VAILVGVAVAFAAHAYLSARTDLVAFSGPALCAVACAVAIRDFERGAQSSIAVGLGTAAFVAFIARTTNPRYTATQFALFTSLAVVPRSIVNASTGWIVEAIGWFDFYLVCAALALPGMALLLRVAPWNEPPPSTS